MDAITSAYSAVLGALHVPNYRPKTVSLASLAELRPSGPTVFALILLSYFLVTGGIIYDVIVEPPSMGMTTDERGNQRPVAFMAGRINGQYITEGLASSFMFTLGGLGFILLEEGNERNMTKFYRTAVLLTGLGAVFISFMAVRGFMGYKLGGYLRS